jgi:hypothetical protein
VEILFFFSLKKKRLKRKAGIWIAEMLKLIAYKKSKKKDKQ